PGRTTHADVTEDSHALPFLVIDGVPVTRRTGPVRTRETLPGRVVRCFRGDRDVVRVTLLQPCSGDLHELSLLKLLDRRGPGVSHRGAQTAEERVPHLLERAADRHRPPPPRGNQRVRGEHVVLEVAVRRGRLALTTTLLRS